MYEEIKKTQKEIIFHFSLFTFHINVVPLPDASIQLLAAADSSVITTFHAEPADTFLLYHFGMFELPVKEVGKYLLRVSCLGFKTQYKAFEVTLASNVMGILL